MRKCIRHVSLAIGERYGEGEGRREEGEGGRRGRKEWKEGGRGRKREGGRENLPH